MIFKTRIKPITDVIGLDASSAQELVLPGVRHIWIDASDIGRGVSIKVDVFVRPSPSAPLIHYISSPVSASPDGKLYDISLGPNSGVKLVFSMQAGRRVHIPVYAY